jgi:hypothetical protein
LQFAVVAADLLWNPPLWFSFSISEIIRPTPRAKGASSVFGLKPLSRIQLQAPVE